jgi:hypothetical protein
MTTQEMERASGVVLALKDGEIASAFSAEELIDKAHEFCDSLKNEAAFRTSLNRLNNAQPQ